MNQTGLVTNIHQAVVGWLSSSKQSYLWGTVTGFFSTLTIQDYTFVIGALFSALMTYKTYRSNLREKQAKRIEDEKRTREVQKQTQIIQSYLQSPQAVAKASQGIEAITEVTRAVQKADEYTSVNVPVGDIDEESA